MASPITPLSDAQETALATLNDRWGVASWQYDCDDGILAVVFDDGDETTIEQDGSCPLLP